MLSVVSILMFADTADGPGPKPQAATAILRPEGFVLLVFTMPGNVFFFFKWVWI